MFRPKRPAVTTPVEGVVVGTLASHDHAVVGPAGEVSGLEWVIGVADEWLRPGTARPSAISQRLVDGLPVVETSVRVPGGQVLQRVWAVADGGAELAVLEIENRSKEAVSVALAGAAVPEVVVGRTPSRRFPDDGPAPFDDDALPVAVWPLAHTASLRVAVVLDGEWDGDLSQLPDADAVVRGWRAHIDAGARIELPDPGLQAASVTARAALLIRGSRPSSAAEAAVVAAAFGAWGFDDAALAPIEVLLDEQRYDGSFGSPQATADSVAAWWAHVRRHPGSAERLAEPAAKAAHRLSKLRWKSAPPPWIAIAQADAAALLDVAHQPDAAALCRSRLVPPPAPPAPAPPRPDGSAVGHVDLADDARFLLDLHALLVDDTVPGVLTFVPSWPDVWLGAGLEAHRLPTRAGLLSFAVRWHGSRPAVLWELDAPAPVELRAGLDPAWCATEPAGEALLAPVEPAGGLPGVVQPLTGATTPVDEAPDDGVSFR